MSIIEIGVDFTFEAAHWLPMVPEEHKCRRMHGHSYRVTVTVRGPVGDDGMLIDYANIRVAAAGVIKQLDHHTINKLITNPTAENIAIYIWDNIIDTSALGGIPLHTVTVHETATTHVTYRGEAE